MGNNRNLRNRRGSSESQSNRQESAGDNSLGGATEAQDSHTLGESGAKENETPPSSHPRRRDGDSPPDRQPDFDDHLDEEDESDEEEALQHTFEMLAKRQRIAALKEKIALMQRGETLPEVGGVGTPAVHPVLAVATPGPTFKEPTPHLAHIPDYTATSVKDHHEWEREWRRLHAVSPAYYQRDANKINVAATKLKGPLADAWEREEQAAIDPTSITWRYFCDFLLNFIDDPANRHSSMYRSWRKCSQGFAEDLHAYYQRLETIQSEIPELSEEIKRMHFLSTMRPGLRKKLVELQKDDLPRHELLKIGASLERNADQGDNTVGVQKAKPKLPAAEPTSNASQPFKKFKNRGGQSSARGGKSGYHNGRGDSTSGRQHNGGEGKGTSSPNNIPLGGNKSWERKPLSEMECYECHKKGHLKPNCPALKQRAAGASKANHQSKNEKASQ